MKVDDHPVGDHPPGGWGPGPATTPGGIGPWVDDHPPTEDHPQNLTLKILPVGRIGFFDFVAFTVLSIFRLGGTLAAKFGPGFKHLQIRIRHPPGGLGLQIRIPNVGNISVSEGG